MPDLVVCRSDSQYAERPLAFHWQGERLEVTKILARWRTPAGQWFRVQAGSLGVQSAPPSEEMIFDLCYDETIDGWRILPR
ncbi:MAG: hypothetical protein JXA78_02650 [Anaerolineales bacterium]|nr:hypothetical protein [Anaerolineales bacterium]